MKYQCTFFENKKRMRIIFFIIIFFACQAQAQKLQLGIKGGIVWSEFTSDESQDRDYSPRLGAYTGFYLNKSVSDKLSVQTELNFVQTGAEIDYGDSGGDYHDEYYQNYLEVPALAEFKITKFLSLVAGPHVSVLLSSSEDFTSDPPNRGRILTYQAKSLNYGLLAGISLRYC